MRTIIINGDDYGMNERCSRAIAEAFAEGLITDTTMMANGAWFDEAVALARQQGFADRIGVHLNLTEGVPLTEGILREPRFVKDGRFYKGYDRKTRLTSSEKEAVYRELTAQVEKIQGAGLTLTHADSHHHIHTGVYIAPIAVRVCREHGIDKLRLHRNLGRISLLKRIVKNHFNRWLRKQGFVTTEYFAYVMDLGSELPPDNTEIMVHPDHDKNGVLIDRRGMQDGYPVGNPMIDLRGETDIELGGFAQLSCG